MVVANEVILNHLLAKLDSQRQTIAHIRSQASISSAVTGLIGAVFASVFEVADKDNVFTGEGFLGFTIPAFLLFLLIGLSIACSVCVVVRYQDYTFCFECKKMLSNNKKFGSSDSFYEKYIADGEWFFSDNEKKIGQAQEILWWAMVLSMLQIIPWSIML